MEAAPASRFELLAASRVERERLKREKRRVDSAARARARREKRRAEAAEAARPKSALELQMDARDELVRGLRDATRRRKAGAEELDRASRALLVEGSSLQDEEAALEATRAYRKVKFEERVLKRRLVEFDGKIQDEGADADEKEEETAKEETASNAKEEASDDDEDASDDDDDDDDDSSDEDEDANEDEQDDSDDSHTTTTFGDSDGGEDAVAARAPAGDKLIRIREQHAAR